MEGASERKGHRRLGAPSNLIIVSSASHPIPVQILPSNLNSFQQSHTHTSPLLWSPLSQHLESQPRSVPDTCPSLSHSCQLVPAPLHGPSKHPSFLQDISLQTRGMSSPGRVSSCLAQWMPGQKFLRSTPYSWLTLGPKLSPWPQLPENQTCSPWCLVCRSNTSFCFKQDTSLPSLPYIRH